MVVATETFDLDGTTYTVQVENVREYIPGVVAFDVSSRRSGSTAIITIPPKVSVSVGGSEIGSSEAGTPPDGRFQTDTFYAPSAEGQATVVWSGEYGSQTPEAQISFEWQAGQSVGVCDFTNNNGVVRDTIGGVPFEDAIEAMTNASLFSISQLTEMIESQGSGQPLQQCVGTGGGGTEPAQQGISPAIIGLGVLGAGAVAVALSQRD